MRRVCFAAALSVMATTIVACSGNNGSPTAPSQQSPSPGGSAAVRAVVVTSTSTSPAAFQMHAQANMSDGTSRDVTTAAQWQSSDPGLASVSSDGVLSVLQSGQVKVRATYQNVTGEVGLLVSAPSTPATFDLSGVVVETAPVSQVMSGVRVQITQGPDAGQSVITGSGGLFRFATLQRGVVGFEASKDGYFLWRVSNLTLDRDRQIEVTMYPTPPKNDSGVEATARCKDGSWSWAKAYDEACTANGGVAYPVCPGPLCDLQRVAK